MAYISTEEVKEIRTQLKDVLKSKGLKGTVKREHYSKIVLSVKSEGKLINEFYSDKFSSYNMPSNFNDLSKEEQDQYFKFKARKEEIYKELKELEKTLLLPNFRDNSDIMTDYFDVSYYTDIDILN